MTDPQSQYEHRNEGLRTAIDALAARDPAYLEQYGAIAEVARENDLEAHRVRYAYQNWPDLVKHRRAANLDPLDPKAVKAGYDDEHLQQMALDGRVAVADGMGEVTVDVELGLDEAFRAIKLLPGDLGGTFFAQIIEQAPNLPRDDLRRVLDE